MAIKNDAPGMKGPRGRNLNGELRQNEMTLILEL